MKKIISSILLCILLLNSFSVVSLAEEYEETSSSQTIQSNLENNSSIDESSSITEKNSSTEEGSSNDKEDSNGEKKSFDQDEVDYREAAMEKTNHKKGTYALENDISSRAARATVADVYANDPNLPGKNFIDVSSWNGDITVAEYQKIKSYGVTGVSVKLTEGTWYINPFAAGQIRNAKAAGLKVSAYHYSMYVSVQTAQDEARYFAQAAVNSGLDQSTIMFNDAEDPTLTNNGRNAHANSVAFNQQLKGLGYKNDALYVGKWWLTAGYIDTLAFGRDRVWVAQYPYTPDKSMQWNNEHGAWQWSSQMYFPGLANYYGRPFDISMTYSNFLNMGNSGPDLSKYYTTNPGKVVALNNGDYFTDTSFNAKSSHYKKGDIMTVTGVEYSVNGYPRLLTTLGYVNAIKTNVLQVTETIDNYITKNVSNALILKNGNYYSNPDFTTIVGSYSSGEIVNIQEIEYSSNGYPRLKTNKGYINAIKSNVAPLVSNYNDYHYVNPQKVVINQNIYAYTDVNFTQVKSMITKGEILNVTSVSFTNEGYPRLLTDKGYINGLKSNVLKAIPTLDNYITGNVQKVMFKGDGNYYSNVNFSQKAGSYSKYELVDVTGIEYTSSAYPRLVTSKGYVNAIKDNVQQVIKNVEDYHYKDVNFVVAPIDTKFYSNIEFTSVLQTLPKNKLTKIDSIEFTENGYPRLKSEQGYLNAIKTNVTKVINNLDDYYYQDVNSIKTLQDGTFFNDVDFNKPIANYKKGDILVVNAVEYSKTGYPRILTNKGYINSIKTNIKKIS